MQADLYARCRKARRDGTFTSHLFGELMQACGRPLVAARLLTAPAEPLPMKQTGLEYFLRMAKAHQAALGKARS